ncbi:hypothetical protein LAZ67_16002036 [Cordylochernes scorpioides]|uniref:Transposase n=1 Tax=Cordylochernes scorpioides TaxID=51811 RepID=A0ABY6LE91_9ARAC|nr:hypothetical protein LAZ67_16002036 [Cordylochernes scorpioides]
MAQPFCQLNPLWQIVKIPLDPVWISWNKVRPRLTRAISPKPWSLGGRFSVCQSWCCGFVTDTRPLVVATGEASSSEITTRRWCQKFKVGDFGLEDQDGRGRRSTFKNEDIKSHIESNNTRTVREMRTQNPSKTKLASKADNAHCLVVICWIIAYRFLYSGETASEIVIKMPSLVNRKGVILLHDNARSQSSFTKQQIIAQLNYEALAHPPYSPDLSPTDIHFFKHLDYSFHGKQLINRRDLENAFLDLLTSRQPNFYENGIKMLLSRWHKCRDSNGAYFV